MGSREGVTNSKIPNSFYVSSIDITIYIVLHCAFFTKPYICSYCVINIRTPCSINVQPGISDLSQKNSGWFRCHRTLLPGMSSHYNFLIVLRKVI